MTLAQMIARLTRGYIKETGRQPVGLDKLRIKMEAAEKLRQMNKVIQFPQQRSFKQEIESMINDGTIKMGGVTKQSDKVRTRNMFKDSNLNKTEAQIKAEIEANNKKSLASIREKKYQDAIKLEDQKSEADPDYIRKIIDPEDFADGGVAGLLGERPGYQDGNIIQTMYPRGNFLNIRANAPTRKDYNIQATKDLVENLPGGVVRDVLAPAAAATLSVPYDAIQAYNRMEPGSGLAGFKDAFMSENPFSSLKERTIGAAGPLADRFNKKEEKDDEYDFSDIEGQTAFVGLPEIFALGKTLIGPVAKSVIKGGSVSTAAKKALEDKIKREMTKKAYKYLEKKMTKPKYGTTSPTTKTTTTRPGGGRDRNIVSGRGGDRDFSSRGPDTSSNPRGRSNRASQERGYALHGADGGLASFADGGPARQNFAMGKRAFLKLMGGVGAGIAGLKSGLIGTGGKEVTKKAVTETVKSAGSGRPPPYFFKLVDKIKFMGDDTLATQDKAIAKKYKDYVLEEDFAGNISITRKGDMDAPGYEEVYMGYSVDDVPLRGKKGSTKVEEYEEYTVRPDGDGKMKDVEDGVPDDVLDDAGDPDSMTLKKASGGIARMLGE